jgi:hypothetical protein
MWTTIFHVLDVVTVLLVLSGFVWAFAKKFWRVVPTRIFWGSKLACAGYFTRDFLYRLFRPLSYFGAKGNRHCVDGCLDWGLIRNRTGARNVKERTIEIENTGSPLHSCEHRTCAESCPQTALKPRWTWREPFLSGSSLPGHARIAITPDIVHPAHGAAIAEVVR